MWNRAQPRKHPTVCDPSLVPAALKQYDSPSIGGPTIGTATSRFASVVFRLGWLLLSKRALWTPLFFWPMYWFNRRSALIGTDPSRASLTSVVDTFPVPRLVQAILRT